jgi:RimK family alpha-L-glutamate ligase
MRIAVLGAPESWHLHDLRRAAAERHVIVPVAWRDLNARVGVAETFIGVGSTSLMEFDAVLVRTMPPASLEQVVFRMDVLARLEQCGVLVINPPRAMEIAIDKFLALARLREVGLLVPETQVCQSEKEGIAAFEALGRDVVVKPLLGSEGRGLIRLNDLGLAERVFALLARQDVVLYVQRFIQHPGYDIRVLVIGTQTLAVRRGNDKDWRTNLSRGAAASPLEIDDTLRQMALDAARAVGAPVAGMDLLPDRDGQHYVIEVNAAPGWKGLSRTLEVDVASLLLRYIERRVEEMKSRW